MAKRNLRWWASGIMAVLACLATGLARADAPARKPNIILILADDLGWKELGAYGQEKIRTPNIDRLAAEGMRFRTFYSGSPVCASTRSTLLTGLHTGHTPIRDNEEIKPEGQRPLPAGTVTLGHLMRRAGYVTACVGKWGLGGPGSTGEPKKQGFDHFYGHLCQRVAHNHYTTHVWRDGVKEVLEGNTERNVTGKHYTPDLMADDAVKFIRENKDKPFFLYFATPLPHVSLQAPEDAVAPYLGKWPEPKKFAGAGNYVPDEHPRATYAAMVTRIDQYVGRILDAVKESGLDGNTLVIFTSDNGPTFNGGTDSAFFDSAGEMRGLKAQVYEGGIRVPMIARWPGRIKPDSTTERIGTTWDFLPTFMEIVGSAAPAGLDGVSLAPTLLGKDGQRQPEYLYWEYHARGGSQAVRQGKWKGVRVDIRQKPDAPMQLFDLESDPNERKDVAAENPEIARRIGELMRSARTPSDNPKWNFTKG